MSLFRPARSPYWYYNFTYKGIRYYGQTGVADKATAKGIEAAVRAKAAQEDAFGRPKKRPVMVLKEAFGRYDFEIGQHTAGAASDLQRMEVLTEILGAETPLSEIDDNALANAVARIRGRTVGTGDNARLIAPATVNRYLEMYRRVWRRAAKTWKADVGDEPEWGGLLLDEADERIRSLSADEERRLFQNLRADYHPMVRFAIRTGMRLGNIISLKWRDIDFEAATATIKMKSRKPGGRNHVVPLSPDLVALLKVEVGHHFVSVFTYVCAKPRHGRDRDGKLIVRSKGMRYPFTQNGWRKPWVAALSAAGIDDFRFHDTRHTAATRIVRATGNIKIAKELLGHTDIATTSRYAHVDQADVRAALMTVSQAIYKPDGQEQGKILEDHQARTA